MKYTHLCAWKDHKTILIKALLKHTWDREVIQDRHNGFIMGKSCLTNLVAFYNDVTVSLDQGPSDNICLDFCKVFNTVPRNIHFSKWVRYVFWWMDYSVDKELFG